MKKIFVLGAAALLAMTAAASAQTANSWSGSTSQSGVNYSPTSIVKGGIPGAASVIGSAASSPYKCKDVGGISFPYGGIAIPMSDEECGPIVAAMACQQLGMPQGICQTTLTQNKYIANAIRTHQQVAVEQAQAAPVQYANTRQRRSVAAGPRPAKHIAGCRRNPETGFNNLCD